MRVFLFVVALSIASIGFSQSKTYGTVTIGRWTLEQFPKHFLVKAFKVYTTKSAITGQLTYYQELDEYGSPEGLTVTIQKDDYTSPASAYYYRKGVMVYRATFFTRSSKASDIVNRNMDNLFDGPQVQRELVDGKLKENISYFENGRDQSIPKDLVKFTNDGKLNGSFSVSYDIMERKFGAKGYSKGLARDGQLINFISYHKSDNGTKWLQCDIDSEFVHIKKYAPAEKEDTIFETKKILRHVQVVRTDDMIVDDFDNYSDSTIYHLYSKSKLDPDGILDVMTDYNSKYDDQFAKWNFDDDQLQGNFKGVLTNMFMFLQYEGVADSGTIKSVNVLLIQRDENGTKDSVNYFKVFTEGGQLHYITMDKNKNVLWQKEYKIQRKIVLTNKRGNNKDVFQVASKSDFDPFDVITKMVREDSDN